MCHVNFTSHSITDYVALQQVTHGAIQFTAYEELRKAFVNYRSEDGETNLSSDNLLVS